MKSAWKTKITVPIPIVPLCSVIVAIGVCMQIVTIVFRVRIRRAVMNSLAILNKMDLKNVKEKSESIRMYIGLFLGEMLKSRK